MVQFRNDRNEEKKLLILFSFFFLLPSLVGVYNFMNNDEKLTRIQLPDSFN